MLEKVQWRRSVEEGPMEKIRQSWFNGEDSTELVQWRRSNREDGCQKRWLIPEPTMALIPCERIEEKNVFLY